MRTTFLALLLFLGGLTLAAGPVRADEGTVAVGGEFLLQIRVPVGGKSVKDRVTAVEERLVDILAEPAIHASDVTMTPLDKTHIKIMVKSHLLITATVADGKANYISAADQAKIWTQHLKEVLPRINAQPNPNDKK